MHMGELNGVILSVLGRTVCQAQITISPVNHGGLYYTIG